ncbi:MAG: DNA repair protein RadC [Planctomycetota bacterium]|nr:DNA repair protein RadC [Planctomycetota bacterium]
MIERIDNTEAEAADLPLLRSIARIEREDPERLGVRELVEAILGGKRAAEVGSRIESSPDMGALARHSVRRLQLEFGLSRSAAARLAAAFALGRRVERSTRAPRPSLRAPSLVHELLAPEVRGLARETFHALLLDGKHRLQGVTRISEGTLTCSLVHPREVFGPALREGAAALIVAHNHPSGDPEPSVEDVSVTRRLIEVGRLVGIPLVDHVILGEGKWVSLRERIPFDP